LEGVSGKFGMGKPKKNGKALKFYKENL